MTDDVACTRIDVTRTTRQFPAIFDTVASDQLGLTSILMLARHRIPDSADKSLAAAAGRANAELSLLLVGLPPKPDLPTLVQAVAMSSEEYELAVRRVGPSEGDVSVLLMKSQARVEAILVRGTRA